MKFKILLWFLGRLLKKASKKNPDFQKKIQDKNVVIQFQTKDKRIAKHYVFANNQVKSITGQHENSNLTLSFFDANYAFELLKKPKMNLFMQGIQEQKISISGDMSLVMWFMSLTKLIMPEKK